MISGYLRPNGDWVHLKYSEHETWAINESIEKGLEFPAKLRSAVDVLYHYGYLQISNGNAWFLGGGYQPQKLTGKQLDWLLEHASELNRESRQTLVDHYELILQDTPATDYSTPLIEPTF